ncbi:MAG: YafY family protein [Chryseolinea sp.]
MDNDTSRLSRLAAIQRMLLSKRLLTSTEIAKKFNISVRTVYRDIRALEESGVPIVTEEGKGYSLMEGYKLPPVMFSEREAYALITTEQIVLRSKDASLKKEFSNAIEKIKSVMKLRSQSQIELLANRMYIGKNFENVTNSKELIDIQMALVNFNCIRVKYSTEDGKVSERIIEPYLLHNNLGEDWVLTAYCRLRKDFRSFRLDRMATVIILDEHFEPHKLTLKQYIAKYTKS